MENQVKELLEGLNSRIGSEGGKMALLDIKGDDTIYLQQNESCATCMPVIMKHRLLAERAINEKYPNAKIKLELKSGM